MTPISKHIMLAGVAAAAAMVAPVQAEDSAQDIISHLFQQEELAPMNPEQRAAVLPALALLPGQADAIFAAARAGATAQALLELAGCDKPEAKAQMGSIGSVAICAGGGSANAFQRALPAIIYASQLSSLAEWEKLWCDHARQEFIEPIRKAFNQQSQLIQRNLEGMLNNLHPSPIYAAITAAPGQQAEFQNLCRTLQQCMLQAAQGNDWKAVNQEGYTAGLCTSQLHLYKLMCGDSPMQPALQRALAERQIYLLMKTQDDSLLFIICERPSDIALPSSPSDSLLNTPLLAEADAHLSQLRAAAWLSPQFFQALQTCLCTEQNPLSQAFYQAFNNMGQADTSQQNTFTMAAKSALLLGARPEGDMPIISRPLTMLVWQPQSNLLRARTTMDAWGARFEPGTLRLAGRAITPDTIYYAESTALNSPYVPHTEQWRQAWLNIGQGVFASLRDDKRSSLMPWLHAARELEPDAQAIEASLRAMGDAVGAPLALVSADGAAGQDPAVAVGAVVKDRAALALGWQQLLRSFGQVALKFGISPSLITELPIESSDLPSGGATHTLRLPFLPQGIHPAVAVSDSYITLGYSPALNERLLAAAADSTGHMSFSGAVCAVSFPGWAHTARTMTERSGQTQSTAMSITLFLERLANMATRYLHATTIQNGAVITGSAMYLK